MHAPPASLPYFLAFAKIRGIGPVRLRKLIAYFGSLENAWNAGAFELIRAGLDDKSVGRLHQAQRALDPQREFDLQQRSGILALCWDDPAYPSLLKRVSDPPPVLFVRGDLLPTDAMAIAIVGTRKATSYGRDVAECVAAELARAGVTVVSGLARGIDGYAHHAALAAGGRSIAVLACGVDTIYPPMHAKLGARIAEAGAIVSDYPIGAPPEPANFPPRNRIISGLSLGTVVVEADVKSGSLITAGFAAEQGRDVFAVPGNIFNPSSRGTNLLIQQGAMPVVSAESVLQQLNLQALPSRGELLEALDLSADERAVLSVLSHDPTPIDHLVRTLCKPADAMMALLAILELRGIVRQSGGQGYVLRLNTR
jgi:DNA processing protein